jgi:hypothetical protein
VTVAAGSDQRHGLACSARPARLRIPQSQGLLLTGKEFTKILGWPGSKFLRELAPRRSRLGPPQQ